MKQLAQHVALSARYGISTQEPIWDLDARRHLMPTLMDELPTSDQQRCVCPGGKGIARPCVLAYTQAGSYLCDACRAHCYGDRAGETVRFVEAYGAAHRIVPPRQEPHVIELPKPPPIPLPLVQTSAETIVWAPNGQLKRIHAYRQGKTLPTALCKQSQAQNWDVVLRLANTHNELPTCQNCVRLASAREAQ